MTLDLCCGYAAAFVSCIAFGTFAVPIKCEAARKVQVDPLVLQTYKIVMAFITSWLVVVFARVPFSFTPWGLVSGLFMVPGGTAGYFAVRNAGLAVSQGIWSSLKVLVAFLWGILIFHEPVRSTIGTAMAISCLIVGLVGLSWYASAGTSPSGEEQAASDAMAVPLLEEEEEEGSSPSSSSHGNCMPRRRLGLLCACIDGAYGGSVLVPMHFAGPEATAGLSYVISFSIGSLAVVSVVWLGRFLVYAGQEKSLTAGYHRLPSFHVDTIGPYATLAGLIWSLGNVSSILTVAFLGQGVGYSIVQSQLLVAGLWGILYYKEISRSRMWFLFAMVTVLGIGLLSRQHVDQINNGDEAAPDDITHALLQVLSN